jgi:hypothetical protein
MTKYDALKEQLKIMASDNINLQKRLTESEAETAGVKIFFGLVVIAAVIENITWFAMWAWI